MIWLQTFHKGIKLFTQHLPEIYKKIRSYVSYIYFHQIKSILPEWRGNVVLHTIMRFSGVAEARAVVRVEMGTGVVGWA
jgi:hypothetical protein